VPGYFDRVTLADASLTARRIGNAWLVVEGSSGAAQRLGVLSALCISRLALHLGHRLGPH
jgi:hypothetical protein